NLLTNRSFDYLTHRSFILFVAARIRNRNFPEWNFGSASLHFEQLNSNRMHRYARMKLVDCGDQTNHFKFILLPHHVQSPRTVFSATPGEQCFFANHVFSLSDPLLAMVESRLSKRRPNVG